MPKFTWTISDTLYLMTGLSFVIVVVQGWREWYGIGSLIWVCIFATFICMLLKQCLRLVTGDNLPFDRSERGIRIRWLLIRFAAMALIVCFFVIPPESLGGFGSFSNSVEPDAIIADSIRSRMFSSMILIGTLLGLLRLYSIEKNDAKRALPNLAVSVVGILFVTAIPPIAYNSMMVSGLIHIACQGIESGQSYPAAIEMGIAVPTGSDWSLNVHNFVNASYRDSALAAVVMLSVTLLVIARNRFWQILTASLFVATFAALCVALADTRSTKLPFLGSNIAEYYLVQPSWTMLFTLFSYLYAISILILRNTHSAGEKVELDATRIGTFQIPNWFSIVFLLGLLVEAYLVSEYPFYQFFGQKSWLRPSWTSPVAFAYGFGDGQVLIWTLIFALCAIRSMSELNPTAISTHSFYTTGVSFLSLVLPALAISLSLPLVAIAFGNLGFGAVIFSDSPLPKIILATETSESFLKTIGLVAAAIIAFYAVYQLKMNWSKSFREPSKHETRHSED